jgi:hypothetical protein
MFKRLLFLVTLVLTCPLPTSASTQVKAEGLSLNSSQAPEKTHSFQKALQAGAGTRALEQARIDYLLEQVSNSPYNFFRNGSRYTGKRAEAHLKWKYFRNFSNIQTGEDFIEKAASHSKMSGEAYLIEMPNKKRIPLRSILLHELEVFNEALSSKRETA